MKRGDAFPGKHLKAVDVPEGFRTSVTVERVDEELLGQGKDAEKKAVCYFVGKEKGLVLNVTNWNMLQMITGQEDSDNWRGARAVLYRTVTQYGAEMVPALRLDAPPVGQPTQRPVPPPPPPVTDDFQVSDDDVPF
jgi:hypothetical protein